MRVSIIAILAILAVAVGPLAERSAWAASEVIKDCLISKVEESRVAAQESGELMAVLARDGQQVSAKEVLARIEDKLAKLELDVRLTELAVAQKESENAISVEFAVAATKVYQADYERMLESNSRVPGSVPKADELRAWLEWKQYDLQIDKAKFDLDIAVLKVDVSKAQVAAAQEHIARREIKAPWDGIVDEVHRHTGDWVQAGDPILSLVRMDQLQIKASVSADNFSPSEIDGRPVTVKVKLPRGATEIFQGKISGISPKIDGRNMFQVSAEIANKKSKGHWILRPGMQQGVEATIHLD